MFDRITNARVHEHLTPALDAIAEQMHATRLAINSAALYWFLHKLMPEQRAEVRGEYVKVLAMLGQEEASPLEGAEGKGSKVKK